MFAHTPSKADCEFAAVVSKAMSETFAHRAYTRDHTKEGWEFAAVIVHSDHTAGKV